MRTHLFRLIALAALLVSAACGPGEEETAYTGYAEAEYVYIAASGSG